MKQVPFAEIEQLTRGEHGQPHAILGPHPEGDGVTFRVFKPLARTVTVVTADGTRVPLEHEHEGVWVGVLGGGFETLAELAPQPPGHRRAS
jgi:1,4-alpha-glucan branching enzyme